MDELYRKYENDEKTVEKALKRLVDILAVLRKECPWDKVQNHKSLRSCMLEEAYEACEAIDKENMDNLEEELGDVLLQVLFHSALAEETLDFSLLSVINRECEKMIRRHPHVFLKENVKSVDKAVEKWENVKWKEKEDVSYSERMESVPKAMSALIRSYKIQAKAADAGFDWEDASGAFQKVKEETEELTVAYERRMLDEVGEEIGDLLFTIVNLSRFLKVNPELALNATSEKFIRRFASVEKKAMERGEYLGNMSLQEMDALWEQAKEEEIGR
jgi:tetrapyrrole methylase family protein/MazG family protein